MLGAAGWTTATGAGVGAGVAAGGAAVEAGDEEDAASSLAELLPAAGALLDAESALLAGPGACELRSRSDVRCRPAVAEVAPLDAGDRVEATLSVSLLVAWRSG